MRDRDVRKALFEKELRGHVGQPDTRVVNELGLRHGAGRVDVAVINGYLHGLEIKSDADTLERLPGQITIYNSVLDKITIVCGGRHIDKVLGMVPEWWGVKVATKGARGAIHFSSIKEACQHSLQEPVAVAELLWRNEVIEVLADLGLHRVTLRKPRAALYRELASSVEFDDLRRVVRERLKRRENWRGHQPPL